MKEITVTDRGVYLPLTYHTNMPEETKVDPAKAITELAKYFASGNCVPVDVASIRAKDFFEITGLNPSDYVKKT